MALNVDVLKGLKPPTQPNLIGPYQSLAQLQGLRLQNQEMTAQIQDRQSQTQTRQASAQRGQAAAKVLQDHYAAGGDPDDPKLAQALMAVDPGIGEAYAKSRLDLRNTSSEISTREGTLTETKNRNVFEQKKFDAEESARKAEAARKASELIKVTPGEGLVKPGEQQPFYTQPFAPKTKTFEEQTAEQWLAANKGKTLNDYQEMDSNRKKPVMNVNLEKIRELDLQNRTNVTPGQIVFSGTGLPVPPEKVGDTASKRLSDFQTAIEQSNIVEQLLSQLGTSGAIKGYVLKHGIYWPVVQDKISPQQAEAVAETQRLANEYIRQVSGAAVSDQEMQRLSKTVPDLQLSPEANKKIVGHFRRYAQSQFDNYLKLRGWKVSAAAARDGAPTATHRFNSATGQIEVIK